MLRARMTNGVFILGLDAVNMKRLKAGQPIVVSLAEMGGQDDIVIMYGPTIEDIKKEIENVVGEEMPEPTDLNKLRNPQ